MSGLQAIADRVGIEALRGEFTDAAMMRDRGRLASLFTHGGTRGGRPTVRTQSRRAGGYGALTQPGA